MAQAPHLLSLEYTEPNDGHITNYAYHDFVLAMTGYQNYLQYFQNITDFKFNLYIYNNNNQLVKLSVPPNAKSYGVFNISAILQDRVKTDEEGYVVESKGGLSDQSTHNGVTMTSKPHAIHQIDKYARNKQNMEFFNFAMNCDFFSNGIYYESSVYFPKLTTKANLLPFYAVWNACLPFREEQEGMNSSSIHFMGNQTKRFLTNKRAASDRNVTYSDYETLAFFNGTFQYQAGGHGGGQTIQLGSSIVHSIRVVAYGTNGFTLDIPNVAANCGSYNPIFQYPNPNNQYPATSDEGLLYVGVGPKNLTNSDILDNSGNPVTIATWSGITHYHVYAINSSGNQKSEIIIFNVIPQNCQYERIRLAYLNRLGGYDYINLTKKSIETTEITRSNYKAHYGYLPIQNANLGINTNNKWEYGSYEGGTRSYNVNAITTIEANSDFLNEHDAENLKELFTSPVTYIQVGDKFEPVVCTEKNYVLQTTDNDKLKQYIIGIQFGHEQRIQRL